MEARGLRFQKGIAWDAFSIALVGPWNLPLQWVHVYVHICIYYIICMCMYMCMYTYIYIYVDIYIYMHTIMHMPHKAFVAGNPI